jgi:tRNA threonylcarbamoyladenosine biosynthesis protein TsaE
VRQFNLISKSQDQTYTIGYSLGRCLPFGSIIGIQGDIGAGKTVFSKGLASGIGVTEDITSPTYPIILEYPLSKGLFIHMDWYRTSGLEEIEMLGIEEFFTSNHICVIEWVDRAAEVIPSSSIGVSIRVHSTWNRLITMSLPDEILNILSNQLKDMIVDGT